MKPRKAFFSPPRQWLLAHHRSRRSFAAWPVAVRGMVWMVCGGLLFSMLNTIARQLTLHLDVYQSQFLRYLFGLLVILPWVFRDGWRTYMPVNMAGQFWRGGVHTVGLILWFTALPQIPLADMTAIGFTGPIFIMIGAAWFLGEPMRKDRWIAAIVGFAGVLVVVLPKMSGDGGWFNLVMLASSPVFAASFLITKALTRYEKPGVIVLWQALTVSVLSLPMALPQVKAGKLKALAVTGAKRSNLLPDVPTVAEALGMPDFELTAWFVIMAPAKTPAQVINLLKKEIDKILKDPDFVQKIHNAGAEVIGGSAASFETRMKKDTVRLSELIKLAGTKAEP